MLRSRKSPIIFLHRILFRIACGVKKTASPTWSLLCWFMELVIFCGRIKKNLHSILNQLDPSLAYHLKQLWPVCFTAVYASLTLFHSKTLFYIISLFYIRNEHAALCIYANKYRNAWWYCFYFVSGVDRIACFLLITKPKKFRPITFL